MGKKRKYVSPLLLDLVPGGGEIIIYTSMDTGGVGPGCIEETAMFSGLHGAEVYFLNDDGTKTFVGWHQVIEEAEDYDEYYDTDGHWIDLSEYGFDFYTYLWEVLGLECGGDDSEFSGF